MIVRDRRIKATKLGLDLRGGVELVYEGRPTPQVPEVTPQAIDDAIETIRKRTDSLGVSEPEIQRAGREPDLGRAARRAERRRARSSRWAPPPSCSSTTGSRTCSDRGADAPFAGGQGALPGGRAGLEAEAARPRRPTCRRAPTMTPPGGRPEQQHGKPTATTCSAPTRLPIGPDEEPRTRRRLRAVQHVRASCSPTTTRSRASRTSSRRARSAARARRARPRRPARRAAGDQGARGHRGRRGGARPEPAAADQALLGARGRLGADRRRTSRTPRPNTDQNTQEPIVTMEFTDKGREAFARRDQADRPARVRDHPRRRAPAARADLPALRDHARQPDRLAGDDRLRREPGGHRRPHGRADREHRQTSGDPRTWPRACASARCRSSSS